MSTVNQIEQIVDLLQDDFGGCVAWKDVLLIKSSPYSEIARLYGAAISRDSEVKLLDNNGDWYTLSSGDRNVEYVAGSVLQRLKYLKLFVKQKAEVQ